MGQRVNSHFVYLFIFFMDKFMVKSHLIQFHVSYHPFNPNSIDCHNLLKSGQFSERPVYPGERIQKDPLVGFFRADHRASVRGSSRVSIERTQCVRMLKSARLINGSVP